MLLAQFSLLETIDNLLWGYAVLPLVVIVGLYLSYRSRFLQIRRFPYILIGFFKSLTEKHEGDGVHPLKAFFTCIGGCMGIGNVVAVCTAIQLGGPGALFWMWITALLGMILKYSEVYLGVRHRISNKKGGYRGGPMYFLQKAFKQKWIPQLACLLLCIYGIEIYQFSVITESISSNFEVNKYLVALCLLALIIMTSRRGIGYVGSIASVLIPLFIISYLIMATWVFIHHIHMLPSVLKMVFESAFSGHAAVGAFAGSTILYTASQGVRRSCYTGDLAIGYASVIHSETRGVCPEKQASLVVVEIFLDSFVICTTSVLLVLLTGVWDSPIESSMLVQHALAQYFPGMHLFMPIFFLLLGFTTIIAYFCAGIKCAEFICPKIGRKSYYIFASIFSIGIMYFNSTDALTIISITAGLLLLINLVGILRLRRDLGFSSYAYQNPQPLPEPISEEAIP